jgi:hypothetical protein
VRGLFEELAKDLEPSLGESIMTRFAIPTLFPTRAFFPILTLLISVALTAMTAPVFAQAAAPTPWVLEQDLGYGYGKDGKTFSYKMGTDNAKALLKGAKKVPKGTLFFMGENGQLYMRTGPYLEGDGKFMFGPG